MSSHDREDTSLRNSRIAGSAAISARSSFIRPLSSAHRQARKRNNDTSLGDCSATIN